MVRIGGKDVQRKQAPYQLIRDDIRYVMREGRLPEFHQVVTSPPYWRMRHYGIPGEIGWELTSERYVIAITEVIWELSRLMDASGTIFLNLGDRHEKGQLQGLPWRIALRLVEAGLVLKSECIWHKRRIMPQSAKNRFTHAHEQVFMFTTKASGYTFNHEAVMEDALWKHDPRAGKGPQRYREKRESMGTGHTAPVVIKDRRLCRSVWDIQTNQLDKGHSATFPAGLPERCILAGSSPGDTVLDPFAGTCTTGVAALAHGRNFIGVDISESFLSEGERYLESQLGKLANF